ncbi:MAG TPA: NAD(P)H-hydrate dehydratase [Pyrinomonadaceae bacterium]|nr:NAD(P)H-hydrate dehydratase [Pyrinomonadaceae bacterium]
MQPVLTAAQMREVDRLTTEIYGIPSIVLMENAAHAVARVITEKLGGSVKGRSILILCGKGNNGGDGAALARLLVSDGGQVTVVLLGKVAATKGDARTNFDALREIETVTPPLRLLEATDLATFREALSCDRFNCIIDAMFGTGLDRPPEGLFRDAISEINATAATFGEPDRRPMIVSVDIPSGLFSDLSNTPEIFLEADTTVTFTAPKPANVLAPSSSFNGELIVADIGSPRELIDAQTSQLYLAEKADAANWLEATAFSAASYKNERGHSLIIAGSREFSGAAVLAGNSAMRSGVGLVTVVTPTSSKDATASRTLPEVMVRGVAETESGSVAEEAFDEIADILKKADSIAVGSGLSQNESTRKFVEKVVVNRSQPVVVDADALNLLSPFAERVGSPHVSKGSRETKGISFDANRPPAHAGGSDMLPAYDGGLILTPHEGEFARLRGERENNPDAAASLKKDRVAVVREFATKHNVILVLKGERVLIAAPDGRVVVNPTGNSGLGKAGNGDTLTGIIAGFTAQAAKMNIDIFKTVVAAVYVAGMAGDLCEKKYGKRVMTASDVRECLSDAFASLSAS